MPAITISKLVKRYGSNPALRDVSLNVESGEIFGFLGPNGAGKTTTIRCMMDFIRPDAGSIKIFGKDAHDDSVATKEFIGYLPADSQLYPKWTAKDHVEFVNSIRGYSRNTDALISRLDLDPSRQIRHMSTGNKQKLGLILALQGSPELLILDEPTKGLDPLLQHEMYAILKEYVAGGGTVFLSSHNLAEVERICTNVGIIKDGKIVASKSMEDIRAMKIHLVTALVSGPVNLDDLRVDGTELINASNGQVVLKVRGDLNPLIAKLGTYDVRDLEITHAPLEDIFMEYYRSES